MGKPDRAVVAWLDEHELECALSTITLAELRYGIERLPEGKPRSQLERDFAFFRQDLGGRVAAFDEAEAAEWERLFLLVNEGLENEYVRAFAVRDGKQVWQTRLGNVGNPEQQPKFPAARSIPTVDGEFLYALGSDGDLACLETATGKVRWQKNLRTDFGGKPGIWAYSESPLLDGDSLVCTPGGAQGP